MSMASVAEKAKTKIGSIKFKKPGKKPSKKAIIFTVVALILIVAAIVVAFSLKGDKKESKVLTAKVSRGDVTKVIEGSGTIRAVEQYDITALVSGEILRDHFEEGQEVKEGDLLYEIDMSTIENSIEKSQASLEKTQLSYEQSVETVTNLTVRSPISGTVQNVYIENGSNVGNNSKVADVINSDYMRLKINFNHNDAQTITVGAKADVYLESTVAPVEGKVESVATGSLVNESGAPVTPVEIVVANPGAIRPGDMATAVVGNVACNDAGTFEYYDTATITAKASGEAYNLSIKAGDKVNQGDAVVYLESSSARVNARQSQLSLKDAQLALQNLVEDRDDYNIKAPISGKVIQKNSKAGDKLGNGDRSTVMAIIADLSSLVFEISVDELDIGNIKVGQTVTVTADALEGRTFTGHVENVSIVGSSSNGVTSYPVKVVMEDGMNSGLIPGMNVNANIVIDSRTDVLRVPVSAIQRGNIVYVKNDSPSLKNKSATDDKKETEEKADNKKKDNKQKEEKTAGIIATTVYAEGTETAAASPKTEETKQPEAKQAETKAETKEAPKAGEENSPNAQSGEGSQRRPSGNGNWQRPSGNGGNGNWQRPSGNGGANRASQGEGQTPATEGQTKASATNEKASAGNAQGGQSKGQGNGGNGSYVSDRAMAREAFNERLLKTMQENAPEGFTAVIVTIGLSDENYTEIISGLEEGDTVYLPDKTAANNTGFGNMRGGMGGMGMGGMMGGMGGANRSGSAARTTGTNRNTTRR